MSTHLEVSINSTVQPPLSGLLRYGHPPTRQLYIIMKSTGVLTLSAHIHFERQNSYVVHCTVLGIML